MTINNNFSPIIQRFMMNEINAVINKYSNIESEKLEFVEELLSIMEDGTFKEELLEDFDKTLKLATEVGENIVDKFKIEVYLWMKEHFDSNISINELIRYIEEVEEEGYVEVKEGIIIYKKDIDLTYLAKEKLETMLSDERFVDKLLDKDSLIDYWMNGTSKDQVIRELINGIEVEELLDFDSKFIIENEHGEKYMYAEIEC